MVARPPVISCFVPYFGVYNTADMLQKEEVSYSQLRGIDSRSEAAILRLFHSYDPLIN